MEFHKGNLLHTNLLPNAPLTPTTASTAPHCASPFGPSHESWCWNEEHAHDKQPVDNVIEVDDDGGFHEHEDVKDEANHLLRSLKHIHMSNLFSLLILWLFVKPCFKLLKNQEHNNYNNKN